MVRDSAFFVSLCPDGEPDVKFAVELGIAIMLDKPIIVAVIGDRPVPERLRRVADRIVRADDTDELSTALALALKELRGEPDAT